MKGASGMQNIDAMRLLHRRAVGAGLCLIFFAAAARNAAPADALSKAEAIVSALKPISLAGLTVDFPLSKQDVDLVGTTWIVESSDGQKDRWEFTAKTVDYQNLSLEADRGTGSWS